MSTSTIGNVMRSLFGGLVTVGLAIALVALLITVTRHRTDEPDIQHPPVPATTLTSDWIWVQADWTPAGLSANTETTFGDHPPLHEIKRGSPYSRFWAYNGGKVTFSAGIFVTAGEFQITCRIYRRGDPQPKVYVPVTTRDKDNVARATCTYPPGGNQARPAPSLVPSG